MKAITRNTVVPKILAANLSEEHDLKIRAISVKYRAEYITVYDLQKSIAFLAGEKTADAKDSGKYSDTDSECLLFAGFERGVLNRLLDDFKTQSIRIPLKAMYTPYNRDWSFAHLINELTEEHRRMIGGVEQ